MKIRDVIKLIEEEGWLLVATKGSHRQFSTRPSQGVSRSQGIQVMISPQAL